MNNIFCDNLFDNSLPLKETDIFQNDESYINNQNNIGLFFPPSISEEEKDIKSPFTTVFKPPFLTFEQQATNYETKKKDNELPKNIISDNSNIKVPKLFTYEDIREIIKNKNDGSLNRILDYFKKDEMIEKYENDMQLLNPIKKRNRTKNKRKENEVSYGRGRKKKDDNTKRKHSKYSVDNIMKKIKSKLIDVVIDFINKIVNNKNYEESIKVIFKKIDYKYINQMRNDLEIELLNGPIKDLLLKDVSPKFGDLSPDSNRTKFENLMENEKSDETIMFALNLSFKEFIELLCSKKSMNDIENSRNVSSDTCQKIMNEFPGIDSLLNKILKKNDTKFISHYIFLLYNYEKCILSKKGRKSKIHN